LLVDCNLQFGDVDAFLNLQAQSNISDLTKAVNDLDQEVIDSVLVTHGSGLKVLVAPSHPEHAYDIHPDDIKELILILAGSFDFVLIDMPTQYDDLTLKLFDVAERVLLISTPTIPAVRNVRKMLDIFDTLEAVPGLSDKILFVLNRISNEKDRGRGTVPTASIENHLKREVVGAIPVDDRAVLTAVNQGVPLVAKQKTRSPGRELVALAEYIRRDVGPLDDDGIAADSSEQRSTSGLRSIFGG